MAQSKKRKYNLTDFFSNYFRCFGKLVLVNLMFCIPLAVFAGAMALILYTTGYLSFFVIFLIIPLMSPFFAGLTNVCRKLTADKNVRPVKDFFGGIKNNWVFFLINSFLLYFMVIGLWLSIAYYKQETDNSAVLIYLIIMSITALVFVLVDMSAIVMTVSVELRFTEVIRNSFIMIINGFTNHLKTFLSLLFTAAVIFSVVAMLNNLLIVLIVMGLLVLTVAPVMIMYIIVYNSYQTIEKNVITPYAEEKKEEQRVRLEKEADDKLTIEDLEPLSKGDPEEYVFINGKTVKRKTVIKMIEIRKSKEISE